MKKTKLVPNPPRKPVVLDQDQKEKLQKWVEYFRAMSPHLKVISFLDQGFDKQKAMDDILSVFKDSHGFLAEIHGLQPVDIAIIICPPISLIAENKQYRKKDMLVFCFHNHAFSPDDEARNGDYNDDERQNPENAKHDDIWRIQYPEFTSWNYQKDVLLVLWGELLKEVPDLPEN